MIINPYIYGVATSYDPDAQLFFNAETAAGVSLTTTQMNAVNQWVIDAKAAGIWTKFKAVYPMVGGTATAHKFNLINPADTNAAFRLTFTGGWTHSSTGALPNGTNAYADTNLVPSTAGLGQNSTHLSFYSRTNNTSLYDFGHVWTSQTSLIYLQSRATDGKVYYRLNSQNAGGTESSHTIADSLGLFTVNRNSASSQDLFKNSTKYSSNFNSYGTVSTNILLGALYVNNSYYYGARQCAFASIGDGLTDLESQLFYQITEKYQVALGRNVNATQSFYYNAAYNNETNAFLFSTQITDNTIQTATNTLVNDLKTANVWTKIKAIYPIVGGTATTHKFNLVNAQDSNAAFRLNFVGGWTHSSNGALPNGTNAYANTFLNPNNSAGIILPSSAHLSYYSRTTIVGVTYEIGGGNTAGNESLALKVASNFTAGNINIPVNFTTTTDAKGFWAGSKRANNDRECYRNGISQNTITSNDTLAFSSIFISLGAFNNNGSIIGYSAKECAFATIGDGLTDAEALSLYNAVQTFQTTLGRQV